MAEKKKREEDQPRRIRRGDRPKKREEEEVEEISNMGMACNLRILFVLFVFVSFFCFFLCQSLTFFLSLNPNHSSSLFWFMGSWVWFMGSWVHAVSRLLIYGFDFSSFGLLMIFLVSGCWWFFWVHGFDYLLRKSIKEKKILIILIFWASFHLIFCRTWRTVLGSPALFWVCICSGFALVLGLFLILGFISCFSGFDGD